MVAKLKASRPKFKIMYPYDHEDKSLRGKRFKLPPKSLLLMGGNGVFFIYSSDGYNSAIQPLSKVLPKYDVVWRDINTPPKGE